MENKTDLPTGVSASGSLPKKYVIDLGIAPEHRWDHVLGATDPEHIRAYVPFIDESLRVEFGGFLGGMILPSVFWLLSLFACFFDTEYIREMRGIARHTEKYGLTFSKLFQLNFGYDFLAACTSGVIRIGGEMWHLRNMDWGREQKTAQVMRDCTIEVAYERDGREIYRGTTWIGFVGLLTGISRHAEQPYTVSLNYRRITGNNIWNILRFFRGIGPITFLIRRELQADNGSVSAMRNLYRYELMAPCYLIFGTPHMGQCQERDRYNSSKNYVYKCEDGVLMTNIDSGVEEVDPKWADGDDLLLNALDRRACFIDAVRRVFPDRVTNERLHEREDKIDALFKVMRTPPVFNGQTIYTVIMSPSTGEYITHAYL